MLGKIVISVVSVLLMLGVGIGLIFVDNNRGETSLSRQMKAVQAICQRATDQAVCVKTLENIKSDDPKELVKVLVVVAQEGMVKAYNFTEETLNKVSNVTNSTGPAALYYCKRVFDYALMDLDSLVSSIGRDLKNLTTEKYYYLKQRLLNTWIYQFDCLNDIVQEDIRKTMEAGVADARKLTLNAMNVMDELGDVFTSLGIHELNVTAIEETVGIGGPPAATARHLLGGVQSWFPSWVSAADRKLLVKAGHRGHRGRSVRPSCVVARDGSGNYKKVSEAVKNCPNNSPIRCIIYVKAGVYHEMVVIPKTKMNIFMYGDGARKTIITYNKSVKGTNNVDSTALTGTVQVEGAGFMAKYIGFKNTAGPAGHQAVALRIQADRSVVFNCRMDGYQDTLFADAGSQFYRNCVISGTVDFIFGNGATVIQNSLIIARRGAEGQFNTITADGRENDKQRTGIIIQNCRIAPDKSLAPVRFQVESYLGRPWKAYARTIITQTEIEDFIRSEGWHLWNDGEPNTNNCFYREYANSGPGARTEMRVKWKGYKVVTNPAEIEPFALKNFVFKELGSYLIGTGIPYKAGQ